MSPLPLDEGFRNKLHKVLDEVATSSHLTEGKFVAALEARVEKETGQYAVAMSSCGAGLFALYRVMGSGQAAVPTNTFYATGGMAREAGMGVQLMDTARGKFSTGIEQAMELSPEVGTVVLTHVGGKMADDYLMIADLVKSTNRYLIEDAAHAFGVPGVGALSDAAVFSLYPTKAVPVGEGGIVITPHKDLAEDLKVFRNYGKSTHDGVIQYSRGFNLRMDEWTAAVACIQVDRLAEIMELRQIAAEQLMSVIRPYSEFELAWSNWYKFPVHRMAYEQFGFKRKTGSIYQVSDQLTTAMFNTAPLPHAADLANSHVCLPLGEHMYEGMSADEITAWLRGEVV